MTLQTHVLDLVLVYKTQLQQKGQDLIGIPVGTELAVELVGKGVDIELAKVLDEVQVGVTEAVGSELDEEELDGVLVELSTELVVESSDVKTVEEVGDVVDIEGAEVEALVADVQE